jgi:hypothetical protein
MSGKVWIEIRYQVKWFCKPRSCHSLELETILEWLKDPKRESEYGQDDGTRKEDEKYNWDSFLLRFSLLVILSDGAASHFKNKFSLFFLTTLKAMFEDIRFMWSFGAPGHCKGI